MGRTQQELITNNIPFEDQLYVDRLRSFLGDTAELNVLDELKECTDVELHHAIQDTIDEINYEFLPATTYQKISEVPS